MSVKTQIGRIETNIANAYTALSEKGATMPDKQNSENLAATARTLPGGGEDVTEETNEYTEKLEALETAITALENELEGKASGGASIEAWTGTVQNMGGPLGGAAPSLYYTDETLTPRMLGDGNLIDAEITIAAGTALYFSMHVDFAILDNAEEITGSNDSWACSVIRPTANGFAISN